MPQANWAWGKQSDQSLIILKSAPSTTQTAHNLRLICEVARWSRWIYLKQSKCDCLVHFRKLFYYYYFVCVCAEVTFKSHRGERVTLVSQIHLILFYRIMKVQCALKQRRWDELVQEVVCRSVEACSFPCYDTVREQIIPTVGMGGCAFCRCKRLGVECI